MAGQAHSHEGAVAAIVDEGDLREELMRSGGMPGNLGGCQLPGRSYSGCRRSRKACHWYSVYFSKTFKEYPTL